MFVLNRSTFEVLSSAVHEPLPDVSVSTNCHERMTPMIGTVTVGASPMASRIAPPASSAMAAPIFAPMAQMATERPRFSLGTASRMMDMEPGPPTASPAPMPRRPMNMAKNEWAKPQDIVQNAQKAMAADMTGRRGNRSMSMPAGIAMPK